MDTFKTEELVKMYTPLIYKIARKFYNVEIDDLFQEGAKVITQAYKNYRKDGTTKFSTYVYPYIYGAMYTYVNKQNHPIKITKEILSEYKKIEQARYQLAQDWHRIPTYDEVALFIEKDIQEVNQIVSYATTMLVSMDKNEENDRSMYETIPEQESISLEEKLTIYDGLDSLNEDEKKILHYRYFEDLTQSEVARKLHKTQVMISRYEKKGLEKMKSYIEN